MSRGKKSSELTPDVLLKAYSIGLFPMAESADDPALFWVDPELRGIFPLDGLIISRKLARKIRGDEFTIRTDHDFDAVIAACAAPAPGRGNTWINARIRSLYRALFERGQVHTVEAYQDGALVGGLYGLSIGAVFCGESMFHTARDASKVALAHLGARLRRGGYRLLDTQFVTPHLESLGAVEIGRADYHARLEAAIDMEADFYAWPRDAVISGAEVLAALR